MPKGVFVALMEVATPGQYDVHLIHAEDDTLCDWHPSQADRHIMLHRLDYTLVAESDKWMGADKHKYWHWLHCRLPVGRHSLSDLKLSHPDIIPVRDLKRRQHVSLRSGNISGVRLMALMARSGGATCWGPWCDEIQC